MHWEATIITPAQEASRISPLSAASVSACEISRVMAATKLVSMARQKIVMDIRIGLPAPDGTPPPETQDAMNHMSRHTAAPITGVPDLPKRCEDKRRRYKEQYRRVYGEEADAVNPLRSGHNPVESGHCFADHSCTAVTIPQFSALALGISRATGPLPATAAAIALGLVTWSLRPTHALRADAIMSVPLCVLRL